MKMQVAADQLHQDLRNLKKDPTKLDPGAEAQHLLKLIEKLPKEAAYEYKGVINAGGSGIVIDVLNTDTDQRLALKLSRKSVGQASADKFTPVDIQRELLANRILRHNNIIGFHRGDKIEGSDYYLVHDQIEGVGGLNDWLATHLEVRPGVSSSSSSINGLCGRLGRMLEDVAAALQYIHDTGFVHMDVKPQNILVDSKDKPYVMDFGFTVKMKASSEKIPVGFTFPLQHPKRLERVTVQETFAKSSVLIAHSDVVPKLDIYAFGRTIQYLLKQIHDRFGDRARATYNFCYLNLIAMLCLDGCRNHITQWDAPPSQDSFYTRNNYGWFVDADGERAFGSFTEIKEILERLSGRSNPLADIPELNPYYPTKLNHGLSDVNLSPRLAALIQHPLVRRLRRCRQLGTAEEVYPNATHCRFAHSLGVVGLVCKAIVALYNDPENPLFRVLFSRQKAVDAIAASVVHDLGQTTYGHDLEEVDKVSFNHAEVGRALIQSKVCDNKGRTLSQLLTGTGQDEWGISAADSPPLSFGIKAHKDSDDGRAFSVYRQLIDGAVDMDKLDYVVRDSRSTGVFHGLAIDEPRILMGLTTLVDTAVGCRGNIILGIREKSLASVQMLLLVRRKLYESVYLHHTKRAFTAMLKRAICLGAEEWKRANSEIVMPWNVTGFAAHLEGVSIGRVEKPGGKSKRQVEGGGSALALLAVGGDGSVAYFEPYLQTRHAIELMQAFQNRCPYRRLWQGSPCEGNGEGALRSRLDGAVGIVECKRLALELIRAMDSSIEKSVSIEASASISQKRPSELYRDREECLIIIDLPTVEETSVGSLPPVLDNLNRKRGAFVKSSQQEHFWPVIQAGERSDWCHVHVFAEPGFQRDVLALLPEVEIDRIVVGFLKG